jgi:hypothetical protein
MNHLIFNLESNMGSLNKQFFIKKVNLEKAANFSENLSNLSVNNINNCNNNFDDTFIENVEAELTNISIEKFIFLSKKKIYLNNLNKMGISKDSFNFLLELYNELKNVKITYYSNLRPGELTKIKIFLKAKPFRIVGLDKNVGTGIISNELYDELVYESLNDIETYEELESNPLDNCRNEIEIKLIDLFLKKKITNKLHDFLKNCPNKLGNFGIIPKIHKTKFSTRPIISYVEHFTNNLCIFLDILFKPHVQKCKSYIQDSQNFIQKTKDICIDNNDFLAVADFTSLYSNIDLKDCLEKITDFFTDKLDSENLKIEVLHEILKIVLENNYFKYKDKFYKQKKGIAMGSKCGPSIANLYVYIYENKWLHIHRPKFYLRFIDDICLSVKNKNDLETLKSSFRNLTLNIETGESLPFLDITVSKNKLISRLNYSLYIKPTNTFQYLQIDSNHPSHIFKNLAKSLFIRIRRICSWTNDYVFFSSLITKQLVTRGYDLNNIDKIFTMVLRLDRNDLIKYKNKRKLDFDKNFIIKNDFDKNILNFKEVFNKAFLNFKKENEIYQDYKLTIINTVQRNFQSMLVHKFPLPGYSKKNYIRCYNKKCKTCNYSNFKSFLYLKEDFILPILTNSSCDSKNLIYILFCNYCNFFYIGQTMDIKERIYKHLYDIKTFVPYSSRSTSVSIHFNLRNHCIDNFSFYIFRKDIDNLEVRLFNESFLINLCKKLGVNLINNHIPIIKDYYNF